MQFVKEQHRHKFTVISKIKEKILKLQYLHAWKYLYAWKYALDNTSVPSTTFCISKWENLWL